MNALRIIGSKASLPGADWKSVAGHAALVTAAAVITWLLQQVSHSDFGQYTPVVVAVSSLALAWLKKFADNPAK